MNDPLRDWLYPELGHCRGDSERSEAVGAMRSNRERLTIAALMAPFLVSVGVATWLLLRYRPVWMGTNWLIGFGAAVGGSAALLIPVVLRGQRRVRLRQFLLARGVPLCLHCGYDLRGLAPDDPEPRCPECAHGILSAGVAMLRSTRVR
ncbi:MAG TPA: hypothetical protein DEB06_08220 [Phycisphaerales bacterium]|nr:hypothetical protein [Phycisphaerales bacterium]